LGNGCQSLLINREGEGLALGLEAGDDLFDVHAGLEDFQCDLAADGMLLLGHIDRAKAALADLLEELVGSDFVAGALSDGLVDFRHFAISDGHGEGRRGRLYKALRCRTQHLQRLFACFWRQ
jgi:hypothetical protein